MQSTHRKFSPNLGFAPQPTNSLFSEAFLKKPQIRPRFVSDLALDSTVSRAFGLDNFSLLPIDEPLGKHSYHRQLTLLFVFPRAYAQEACLTLASFFV
jgi:hypothetical protein